MITFISIPTLALYGPVKNHRDGILGSGSHTAVLVGGFLEVIVALASVGTAVTLYPVVKRQLNHRAEVMDPFAADPAPHILAGRNERAA